MAHDAIGAHARDELGIFETLSARPIQAALASPGSFAVGAGMPILTAAIVPEAGLIPLVSGTSLVFLALLGGLAARGWRTDGSRRDARHPVGRIGHGSDCRRRSTLRNSGMSGAPTGTNRPTPPNLTRRNSLAIIHLPPIRQEYRDIFRRAGSSAARGAHHFFKIV